LAGIFNGDEAKIVITVKCESLGASVVGIVASFDQRKQNKHAEPVKSLQQHKHDPNSEIFK